MPFFPKHCKNQNIPEEILHSPPPLLYLNQHHHSLLNKKVQNKNNNPHLLHHNKHQMTNGQLEDDEQDDLLKSIDLSETKLILPTKTLMRVSIYLHTSKLWQGQNDEYLYICTCCRRLTPKKTMSFSILTNTILKI